MSNKYLPTNELVNRQVPAFVRENHAKFIDFLQTYYEYLDQEENINDYIRNVIKYIDIDTTSENFLVNFFEELKNLPKDMLADKKIVASHIYDLYDAKGTPKAIELLFRILYDEEISIKYPSNNILISSDGVWKQNSFFTLEPVIGNLPVGNVKIPLTITNDKGIFSITTNRIEVDSDNMYRVFYNSNYNLKLIEDQYIINYDSSGNKTFSGRVKLSPSKLIVQSGGAFWQIGTIIKVAGINKDTYARVTEVSDGSLVKLEILDFGYGHSNGQVVSVSPFPNKPSGSLIDVNYNTTTKTHTIAINDYLEYSMSVFGQSNGGIVGSDYFLENYGSELYSGSDVFSTQYTTITSTQQVTQDDITLEDWLLSKANIVFVYDTISKPRGEWVGNRGKISNPFTKLQDNSYYQLFSYVVKTENCINKWRKAMEIVHPSGLKYFGDFYKTFSSDVTSSISSSTTVHIT